ncbi:hypothetical protein [Carboxylicivirga marina]|nr:hypothetical protein [Carboxylicivirga marina]
MLNDPYEKNNIIKQKPKIAAELKAELASFLESCQGSFEGDEYGQDSFNKLRQQWSDQFGKKNQAKQKGSE